MNAPTDSPGISNRFMQDLMTHAQHVDAINRTQAYRHRLHTVRQMQGLGIEDAVIERMLGLTLRAEDRAS